MSANKINVALEYDYTWEYEGTIESDGGKATLQYQDDFDGWEGRVPSYGSAHPDISNLILHKIRAKRLQGGVVIVTLDYEVADYEAALPGKPIAENATERFNVEVEFSDEPLLTHHKFATLSSTYQDALVTYLHSERKPSDLAAAEDAIAADPDATEFLTSLKKGQESYRKKSYIWVRSRIVKTLGDIPFEKIGYIDTPPTDANGKPDTPSGYNWLYINPIIRQNASATAYEVEERWQYSDVGGWNTFFYTAPA